MATPISSIHDLGSLVYPSYYAIKTTTELTARLEFPSSLMADEPRVLSSQVSESDTGNRSVSFLASRSYSRAAHICIQMTPTGGVDLHLIFTRVE